jgi:hypothetical protein
MAYTDSRSFVERRKFGAAFTVNQERKKSEESAVDCLL